MPGSHRWFAELLITITAGAASLSGAQSGGYRGPDRNGIFPAKGLMKAWPEGGPELVWRYGNLGNSWAAVTVTEDTVYAAGGGSVGRLFAFTLDGRLTWRKRYGPEFSVRYQGARATPQVSGPHVIVTSGLGVVYCLDAATGETRWSVDTAERFENQVPGWGYNITPLVLDGRVILPIRRGTCTACALDIATGKTIWANEPSEYAVGDSSPALVAWGRTRLVVNNLWNAFVAYEPDTGKIVWRREGKDRAGTSLTPVCNEGYVLVDDNRQTVMLRPAPDAKGFEELWRVDRIFSTAQAVILDGKVFAFGSMPKTEEGGGRRKRRGHAYLCYDARTGELLQAEPTGGSPGSIVAADGMLYWLEDGPKLSLARVTARGFSMVSSFRPVVGDKEMWIHPVIAQGRLFVRSDCAQGGDYARSAGKLAVYDLCAERAPALRARREKLRSLVARLGSQDASARGRAADELRGMGWQARLAVPALADALVDPEAEVRRRAALALAAIGSEAIPALITSLANETAWKDGFAARSLVQATPGAEDLVAAVVDAAEVSAAVRETCAAVLARIGPEAAPAVTRLLENDDRRVRWWAIGVLAPYGHGAAGAVSPLTAMVETGNRWFQAKAARALGAIGPEAGEAVPALLKILEHDHPDVRAAAAEALGAIGEKSPRVTKALQKSSKDADPAAARAAAEALARLVGSLP
jgi:HEAT repeat protein/outer membrane protein assembly factor BamB